MQFLEDVVLPVTPIDRFADSVLRWLDEAAPLEAQECRAPTCPILGLHNTDECADLIEQANIVQAKLDGGL